MTDRGLEPRTNCLRGNCSAIELVGLAAVLYPKGFRSQYYFDHEISRTSLFESTSIYLKV